MSRRFFQIFRDLFVILVSTTMASTGAFADYTSKVYKTSDGRTFYYANEDYPYNGRYFRKNGRPEVNFCFSLARDEHSQPSTAFCKALRPGFCPTLDQCIERPGTSFKFPQSGREDWDTVNKFKSDYSTFGYKTRDGSIYRYAGASFPFLLTVENVGHYCFSEVKAPDGYIHPVVCKARNSNICPRLNECIDVPEEWDGGFRAKEEPRSVANSNKQTEKLVDLPAHRSPQE